MQLLQIVIKGQTSLLMNNPRGTMPVGEQGLGKKTIPTPENDAEARTYKLPNGDLCVPAVAIRNCILNGTAGMRLNKKAARPFFAAALLPADDFFPLVDADGNPIREYEIDIQRVVVVKAGIMRARPKISAPWWVVGAYRFNAETGVTVEMIQKVATESGMTCGILDYRPQKTGWYGTFGVESVRIIEAEGVELDTRVLAPTNGAGVLAK